MSSSWLPGFLIFPFWRSLKSAERFRISFRIFLRTPAGRCTIHLQESRVRPRKTWSIFLWEIPPEPA
jgi:hypothetical protein